MKKTVVAIYNSMEEAKDASDQLVNSGFNRNDIDVSSGGGFTASNKVKTKMALQGFLKIYSAIMKVSNTQKRLNAAM